MRRLRPAVLAVCATTLALGAGPSLAATPEGTDFTDQWFTSGDGTRLHADVIRPKGVAKSPVILSIGPYFAHSGATPTEVDPTAPGEPNERFKDLYTEGKIFEKGYALVQVDLPGFGASQGCNDFGGPSEQAAAKAAVEWAASQPWSTGRVGMWGKSYDGWTQVMAMANKPKGLAATVIQAPIIDGYRTLYQNGVHYGVGWYNTPALYQASDAQPPSIFDSPEYIANAAQGTDPLCYATNIAMQNTTTEKDTPFWAARDLVGKTRGSDVPTLWAHGFVDANTKPDNFLDVYTHLTGPKRAWFGQFSHVRPQDKKEDGSSVVGREGFIDEAMRWMDRYVKGLPPREAPVQDDPAVEVQDGGVKRYRAEVAWPPADAVQHAVPVNGGTTTNALGNDADNTGSITGRTVGEGNWTISQALPYAAHLAGVPRLTVKAANVTAPQPNLFAAVYDIDEKNLATLVTRSASAVKQAGELSFDLYPQDWTFAKGHRIGFALAPGDDNWYVSLNQGGSVDVSDASLSLPFLKYERSALLPSTTTLDQEEAPKPFDVTDKLAAAEKTLPLPPAMTIPPVVTLPTTATPGVARPKLSAGLRRAKGRKPRGKLVASGVAPAGTRVTLRLRDAQRTVATKVVRATKKGRYTATFTVRKGGKFRVVATIRAAGTSVRARSRSILLRTRTVRG